MNAAFRSHSPARANARHSRRSGVSGGGRRCCRSMISCSRSSRRSSPFLKASLRESVKKLSRALITSLRPREGRERVRRNGPPCASVARGVDLSESKDKIRDREKHTNRLIRLITRSR